MKNFKILLIFMLLFFPTIVLAASNPYPKTQHVEGVDTVPCTYVAWDEAYKRKGVALPSWGNAVNWYKKAEGAGYEVGYRPKVNSIAVYSGGCCGHVAYVTEVGETYIKVKQGGVYSHSTDDAGNPITIAVNGNGVSEDITGFTIGDEYGGRILIGFIYLDSIPSKSSSSSSSSNIKTTTKSSKKSDNSYLKSLIIEEIEIEFKKDTFTYYLTVPYEIDKLSITGDADDSKASVTGFDAYDLELGENSISIKVTAEDASTSEYIINVTREEKIEEQGSSFEEETKNKDKKGKKWSDFYLVPLCLVIILLPILIIIIKRKILKKGVSTNEKKVKK